MKLPLRYRVAALVSMLLIVTMGITGVMFVWYQRAEIRHQILLRATTIAQLIGDTVDTGLKAHDDETLQRTVGRVAQHTPDIVYVAVIDTAGSIAAFSGPPEMKPQLWSEPDLTGAVEGRHEITASGLTWGEIRVAISLASLQEQVRHSCRTLVKLAAGSLIIIFGISFWLARHITRPLERLIHGKTGYGQGDELTILSRRLMAAERLAALGNLAAGISHEIRGPLSAIKTYTGLISEKKDNPDFIKRFQTVVPRELDRINGFVTQLLELGRPIEYAFAPADLAVLIAQTIELYKPSLERKAIRLSMPKTALTLGVDAEKIRQVLHNLIQNAILAMPDGGELDFQLTATAQTAYIWIADTGTGIDLGHLSKIYEPFFTTRSRGEGTGLGLSICKKIIEDHAGTLSVESYPGNGTVFVIALPIR